MFLRRLGLYCALAITPFAFLAGCSPTAGIGASPAVYPQSYVGFPVPKVGNGTIPIASNSERGAQDIIGWPAIGSFSTIGFPVTRSAPQPISIPLVNSNNNRPNQQ